MPKLVFNPETKEYEVVYEKSEEISASGQVIPYQDQMTIRRLYGGFPIYNTSTGLSQKEGTIVIIKTNSVSRRLRVRAGNINTSVSLT